MCHHDATKISFTDTNAVVSPIPTLNHRRKTQKLMSGSIFVPVRAEKVVTVLIERLQVRELGRLHRNNSSNKYTKMHSLNCPC